MSKKNVITIISLCLVFFFGLIPAPAGMSQLGMSVIGIFAGTLLLWNCVGIDWPSFLVMAVLVLYGIMKPGDVFKAGYGNATIAFLLCFFMMSYVLSQVGFSRRLAIMFFTNKFAQKSPWAFVFMFLFGAMFVASFMSQTAALLIFLPIAEQIFQELNFHKGDRFPQMMVLGLGFAVGIGSANTPLGHAIILIPLQLLTEQTGETVNIVNYSIFGFVTGILIFLVLMLIFRFLYRPDLSRLVGYDVRKMRAELKPMSRQEKIASSMFLVIMIIWFLQGSLKNVLPAAGAWLSGLGNAVPVMLAIVLLCLIHVDGKPIMDYRDAAKNGVPWAALIFNAAVLVVSSSLTLESVGLSQFLTEKVTPLVTGMSAMVFIVTVSVLCVILTNFASNTVCATIFVTISCPIAMAMGNVSLMALACMIGAAASYAYATPSATMPMAVVAGTGWVNNTDMLKYGGLMAILSAVILALVGYPLAAALL